MLAALDRSRRVVVTGASTGIGAVFADRLAGAVSVGPRILRPEARSSGGVRGREAGQLKGHSGGFWLACPGAGDPIPRRATSTVAGRRGRYGPAAVALSCASSGGSSSRHE